MKRSCEGCGRGFVAKSTRAKFCADADCQRARARARKQKQLGTVVDLQSTVGQDSVEVATRLELAGAGKVSSSKGQAALVMARLLDQSAGDTGSSKAAVAGRLQILMDEVLRDVKVADDPLDEVRARRERRLRSA